MEELSPPESPRDSPTIVVSTMWGRWWLRIPLFVAHLSLLVAAASLTPNGYAVQLGATIGTVIFFGTVALWILLWFARTRGLVLLFCGLVLAQTGITALVGLNFRTEDRVTREVEAEASHRLQQSEAQMASFHLEQLFAMLTPGNEFHPEELPSLLERARRVKAGEIQADWKSWQKEVEQRFAALGAREAADFRRGMEDGSARAEQIRKLSEDYYAGIEELVRLLIERQDRYRPTAAGLVFDRPEDADAFNRILDSLKAIGAQLSPRGWGTACTSSPKSPDDVVVDRQTILSEHRVARSLSSGHATISSAGIDVRVASLAHSSSARATKVHRCARDQLSSSLRPMSAMEATVVKNRRMSSCSPPAPLLAALGNDFDAKSEVLNCVLSQLRIF